MRKSLPLIFIFVTILALFSPAGAAVILIDHFDNSALDPAWTESSINVSGWSYSESGTELSVTDIIPIVHNQSEWGKVILSRTFSQAVADFHLDFNISWDSEGEGLAYQNLYVTLRDSSQNIIALAAYQDPWDSGGQRLFIIKAENSSNEPDYAAGSEYYWSGTGSLPLTGSAKIGITRSGGNIQFFWDEVLLLSGTDARAITQMDIQFWGIDCLNGSFFGTESVDLVRLTDGTPILEPPIADAGADQVVFDTVILDGSASYDPNGTIVSYEWSLSHRENPEHDRSAFEMTPTLSLLNPGFYDVTLTVTDNDGLTDSDSMLLAAAGSCSCSADKMHIESILAQITKGKYGKVTVTVFDNCGGPVPSAQVSGTFSGGFNETVYALTDSNGIAVMYTAKTARKPSYTFCVADVVKGTLLYEPNDNVETCDSK